MSRDRAFLICPVRGASQEEVEPIVKKLEEEWDLHWPPRDTDQNDDTGYRICQDNRDAIARAKMIFVIWDGQSQGCLFDLGMAFALRKTITAIELPGSSEGKSFQNMVRQWETNGSCRAIVAPQGACPSCERPIRAEDAGERKVETQRVDDLKTEVESLRAQQQEMHRMLTRAGVEFHGGDLVERVRDALRETVR